MKLFKYSMLLVSLILSGCQAEKSEPHETGPSTVNFVENDCNTNRTIGNGHYRFDVVNRDCAEGVSSSLMIGFPKKLLEQPLLFGAVITKISDNQNVSLGEMKLSQVTPIWVWARVARAWENRKYKYYLEIHRCADTCQDLDQDAEQLFRIPIVERPSTNNESYLIDASVLGNSLDLVQFLTDRFKINTPTRKLENGPAAVVQADFSEETLAIDIKTDRVLPESSILMRPEVRFSVTGRWYFKIMPRTNPTFESRAPVPGVGFFTTEVDGQPALIQKFDLSRSQPRKRVKYYVKNVPVNRRAAFEQAFKNWNSAFERTIGHPVFDYVFVDESSTHSNPAQLQVLTAGDPRFNIVEWDVNNRASYGGLGPRVINPLTGEILSAAVLVQGPTIEALYKKWFEASTQSERFLARGEIQLSENLLRQTKSELHTKLNALQSAERVVGRAGKVLLHSPAHSPGTTDPIKAQLEFYPVPKGVTFDDYMNGYFTALLTHELGHNLGLRHNFKGSLGADETTGRVSRSIMDYLNGEFRHRNSIGDYDLMAIAYGYLGQTPQTTNWYCTDSDEMNAQRLKQSAECTSKDATSDPFGNFERLLKESHAKLLVSENGEMPAEYHDYDEEIQKVLVGMIAYAASADEHSRGWTNFFRPDRPSEPAKIKEYVISRILENTCSDTLRRKVQSIPNRRPREKAKENLQKLEAETGELLGRYDENLLTPCNWPL